MCEEKGSGIETGRYTWCFTRDVGSMTLEGRAQSVLRMGGLLYSQFYNMIKQQFDAAKHYPWAEDDDTMAMMALDDDYMEAYRSVAGARQVCQEACRESFCEVGVASEDATSGICCTGGYLPRGTADREVLDATSSLVIRQEVTEAGN